MKRQPTGRKKLSVTFTDEQAAWIEERGRALMNGLWAHGNGGEAGAVRQAVNYAMKASRSDKQTNETGEN